MANNRRMIVLRAVVEDYIRTQEPVSSGAITKRHHIDASPATVRNDMAALEDEGYLEQPHTSAGRVPTEKGYRYFVDRLAKVVPLSGAQKNAIRSFLAGSVSLEDVLRRSAQLLAQITGQVAVVASPSLARSALRHIEMVPVALTASLVIVITDTGRVEQRTIATSDMPDADFMTHLGDMINSQCIGWGLARVGAFVQEQAVTYPDRIQRDFASTLAQVFIDLANQERTSNLYMSGTGRLSNTDGHPHDIAPLLDALEEQVVLMHLMGNLSEVASASADMGGVGIAIGSETHTPGLLNTSVVSTGYGHSTDDADHGTPVAFVGSIGPTHMDYATTIAAVQAVARYLTKYVEHEEGIEGPHDADGPSADDGSRARDDDGGDTA